MNKHLRQYIRQLLITEESNPDLGVVSLFRQLESQVSSSSVSPYRARFFQNHADCTVELSVSVDGNKEIWVDKIETFGLNRKTDPNCFRKGYASQMLKLLTQGADDYGITLTLIAAPEPWQLRQNPDLPDKDELAKFYSKHGFLETSRNYAQVYMKRDPDQ
tara:strand:- start:407 stop:889 length:483 start_codon:yes stop_codon:yes gene_type:complete